MAASIAAMLGGVTTGGCRGDAPARRAGPAVGVPAAMPVAAPRPRAPTKRWFLGGQPQAVVARGEHVYVADIDGLSVYALVPGRGLAPVGHVPTPGKACDLAWVGDRLYVADGRAGLAVFSVESPAAPRQVDTLPLERGALMLAGSAQGLAIVGEGAQLMLLRPGARSPERLALPEEPRGLAWSGGSLYVAATGEGLLRVDVGGGAMRVAWRDLAERWVLSVAARGDRLWVGSMEKRIVEYDISAGAPRALGSLTVADRPSRLDVLGDVVLVSSFDMDDEMRPAVLVEPAAGGPRARLMPQLASRAGVLVAPGRAVLALGQAGLAEVDPGRPDERPGLFPGARLERLRADGARLWAWGRGVPGLWSIDPTLPDPVTFAPLASPPVDVAPCAGDLYLLDARQRLCRLERGRTSAAAPGCTAALPDAAATVCAGPLWVLGHSGALEGWAPGAAPRRLSVLEHREPFGRPDFERMATEPGLAVTVDTLQGVLHVLDTGASPPEHRGQFLLHANARGVALQSGLAFVAEPDGGLQIVDVSDRARPRERAWLPLDPGPEAVAVSAADGPGRGVLRIALAQGEAGVSLWAWDGEAAPRPLWHADTPGVASGVAFVGGDVWAVDGTGVVSIAGPPVQGKKAP